jgi:hypothetical protein
MSLTEYSPGDVLTASSLNANLAFAASSSNTNVIINGAMQVAQRGTSTASITTSAYNTADRFFNDISSFGTWTQSVENDAPTGSGFRKSLKMLCTTADASPAAADYNFISQLFEGQNLQRFAKGTASAKQFSLSFWVKSNKTGTYIAELFDIDNTRQVSASYTISVSGTWEKKTITFPADTTGAFDNDNALSLILNFGLGAGSDRTSGTLNTIWAANTTANRYVGQTNLAAATSNYWQITGVQLEVGSVATPFEFEDISTTLAKCFRYFERLETTMQLGNGGGSNNTWVFWSFKARKRATPTYTTTGAQTGSGVGIDNVWAFRSGGNDVSMVAGDTASAEL